MFERCLRTFKFYLRTFEGALWFLACRLFSHGMFKCKQGTFERPVKIFKCWEFCSIIKKNEKIYRSNPSFVQSHELCQTLKTLHCSPSIWCSNQLPCVDPKNRYRYTCRKKHVMISMIFRESKPHTLLNIKTSAPLSPSIRADLFRFFTQLFEPKQVKRRKELIFLIAIVKR